MTPKRSAARNKSTSAKAGAAEFTAAAIPVAKSDAAEIGLLHRGGRVASPLPDVSGGRGILIEMDPVISGGHVHGRFDVMIRGRVVSAVSIKEVRLQADGWVTSTASFSQPERAAAAFMPDGSPARQRAFQFNLPRSGDGRTERCRFELIARTEDGCEHAEDFEIEIDPTAGDPVAIISGAVRSAPGAARPRGVMYIERGTVDARGVLSVQGWAVSLGPILAVDIYAGEERVAEAVIGEARDDVAAVFTGYPNVRFSGFSLILQLDAVHRDCNRIRARAVCPDGFGHEECIPVERVPEQFRQAPHDVDGSEPGSLPLRSTGKNEVTPIATLMPLAREEPSAEIRLFCDAVVLTGDGALSLAGWAVCAIGIVQLRVLLDDNDVGLATYGHDRPDVGAGFPEIPMACLSGFRFAQCVGDRFEGEHQVRVVVRNLQNDQTEQRLTVIATCVAVAEQPALSDPAHAGPVTATTPEQDAEFRFELDSPVVSKGAAVTLVTGRLTIDGWLLTRSGVASFEVYLDEQRLGDVHYGLARQDVGAAFPDWPNALRSGYAFHCPPRSLRDGSHMVQLRIRANNGQEIAREFRIEVKKTDDQQDITSIRRRVPCVEADMLLALLSDMNCLPSFRFILRHDPSSSAEGVRQTLDALRLQAYLHWSVLVLVRSEAAAAAVKVLIDDSVPHLADRFTLINPSNVVTWAAPLAESSPLLIAGQPVLHLLLVAGDEPGADALLELALASARHPDRDMLYGDEVRISPVSGDKEPFFKPDFSTDLLLSTNYIGRPWAITTALLAKSGATPQGLIADGEYDLVLRCAELARGIHHIPKLLCQRSGLQLDDPAVEQAALERMLRRRGIAATVLATPICGTWRVKRALPSKGKVSIIIPTCAAHGHVETCITTLRAKTKYRNFEIICIDNIPAADMAWKVWLQQNADKIVEIDEIFNWSSFNNRAAEVADGEFLLFLNDDIEIVQEDWLDAMLEHAQRPEVGVTGPQLLYRDGRVQHAGMFLSSNGIGRHAFRFAAKDDPGYFGLALTQRNVIAVTGACMLIRSETFNRLGQFDEAHEIVNNDLDFCLRVHRAGLLTVFTPYATLIHYELASRANMKDVFDLTHFDAAWKTTFAAGDPYFSPRLSRHADDYRPDDEPVQWVVSGAPMFRPAEIQRILVVKLDHIGDFVTALAPIRRLKTLFPQARLTVLAGPASRPFIALEPAIDDFIPFAFFHARSQLGEQKLTSDDYRDLADLLRPYRFDLAVDLRKHLSTRDVLKYTGARFLAGFDYLGQFPFLDIALDWDGDRALQRKRSHVVDDLMALVNAIGHASEANRVILQPGPVTMPLTELPEKVRALFAKPVVAIHPGAGNVTKQWPKEHFSALIDLLIEKNDVNIMLVGGPDEVGIADALLKHVLHPDAVATMAGKTSLADLPRLLKNCALFIGNDSGPKHIAAAVGIPTIGIHSGVVDPVEWGPIGPAAVALRRNMTCSPCYLAKAEDCPRSLACLQFFEPNLVYETADLLLTRAQFIPTAATHEALAATAVTANDGKSPLEKIVSAPLAASNIGAKPPRKPKVRRPQHATEPA